MSLEYHPYANVFPLLEGFAFDELVQDIKDNGLQFPIITYEDKILDGRNRYRAACVIAEETNEPASYYYYTEPYIDSDPMSYVLSLNLHRRHLTESQRAMVAAQIANQRSQDPGVQIYPKNAADMMNVSERSVKSARRVLRTGTKKLQESVSKGDVSVSTAEKVSKKPSNEQDEIIDSNTAKQVASDDRNKSKQAKAKKQIKNSYDLVRVEIDICEYCLNGDGGHCNCPKCGLFMRTAPDFPLDNFVEVNKQKIMA